MKNGKKNHITENYDGLLAILDIAEELSKLANNAADYAAKNKEFWQSYLNSNLKKEVKNYGLNLKR